MTTIDEVLQIIKELADTQKKMAEDADRRAKDADRRMKEAENARKKMAEDADRRAEDADCRIKEAENTRKKMAEDFHHRMKEYKKTDEELKQSLNKFIGESGRQWGKFIETLASTNTLRLLEGRGFDVDSVATRVRSKIPQDSEREYEIDVLAVNGIEMVAIEAKKHLTRKDVDIAKKRFQVFKQYNKEAQKKTLYGAVAYLDCDEKVNLYAKNQGLFVFQVTSNSAIIENDKNFKPTHIEIPTQTQP